MPEKNQLVDRLIAVLLAGVVVSLSCVWPFDGIHPAAWHDLAIAAGLEPQTQLLPGLGLLIVRQFFAYLPHSAAIFASSLLAKAFLGGCVYLAYMFAVNILEVLSGFGTRDWRRRRFAIRGASAIAAVSLACSDPMWQLGQGLTAQTMPILLVLLTAWLFSRLLLRATFATAISLLTLLGLLAAESPLGWIFLAVFVFLTSRFIRVTHSVAWRNFLEPIRLQRTKWSMTFVFLASFIGGVLLECLSFALLDGLKATGLSSSDLPLAYAAGYFKGLSASADLSGFCLFAGCAAMPFLLSLMMIRPAIDEEQYLSFKHSIIYFLCGGVAFLQLSPFSAAWFWQAIVGVSISPILTLLGVVLDAIVLAWAVFVLGVEVLCRDYEHIESVSFMGYQIESMDDEEGRSRSEKIDYDNVNSVRLTFGRVVMALVPLCLVAVIIYGRRQLEDRQLQGLVGEIAAETLEEAKDATYLLTDGAFDSLLRLEAKRRGLAVRPLDVLGGATEAARYMRELGATGEEDRLALRVGAGETVQSWLEQGSSRVAETALQLGFELLSLGPSLSPTSYGLLVRPAGGEARAAAQSVTRCHALAERLIALQEDGTWRHAKTVLLKERILAAQFRLAVLCRLRANGLDAAGRAAESAQELELAERLDAHNPSLQKLLRSSDWVRQQKGADLTPREGLVVALHRPDFLMARRYALPVLRQDPDDVCANFALGMSYYVEGQFAKAEKSLVQALKNGADEPAIQNNLALVYLKLGRLAEAEKAVQEACRLLPDEPTIQDTLRRVRQAVEGANKK